MCHNCYRYSKLQIEITLTEMVFVIINFSLNKIINILHSYTSLNKNPSIINTKDLLLIFIAFKIITFTYQETQMTKLFLNYI